MSSIFYWEFGFRKCFAVEKKIRKEKAEEKATVHSAGHSKTPLKNVLSHVKKTKKFL